MVGFSILSGKCVPRARGDGPLNNITLRLALECAPRTRGWTVIIAGSSVSPLVCPAHAGMDRGHTLQGRSHPRVPRARGDGPNLHHLALFRPRCAPRTRGWTER